MEHTDKLLELRNELAAFHTSPCKLVHEKIIGIEQYLDAGDTHRDEIIIHRPGFCPLTVRNKQLGCAHSAANTAFTKLVERLYATGIFGNETAPVQHINDMVVAIYLMDHEKSSLERQRAVAKQAGQEKELSVLEQEMDRLLIRHDEMVAELEAVRSMIMNRLEQRLGNKQQDFS